MSHPATSSSPRQGADLVMDVVSDDDRPRDLEVNRAEYAKAGISEDWIVDPNRGAITVLLLQDNAYISHGEFTKGQTAASRLLPGFTVEVSKAFDVKRA